MPRKKQNNAETRVCINLRVTPEERDAIKKAAQGARKTVSEWVRDRCLVRIVLPRP